MLSGKGIANPSPIAIPWTHSPVASKLGLLFHGLIRLWLRNSGLRPSDSLATTANFISWNNAIASDGLLTPFPCRIILGTHKLQFYRTERKHTMTKGRFGIHGGQYIPETLMNAVLELEKAYGFYKNDETFWAELRGLR